MRYFVESTKIFPRGDTKPLGTYVEVVAAVHMLFPKRKWLTARKGIGLSSSGEVEIFLTTRRSQTLPPSLGKLLYPLLNATIPQDLFGEISGALVLPDELINMVILNNADAIKQEMVSWASPRAWQVKEWPDGPIIK